MRLQTTHSDLAFMACFRRPACPLCGDQLFAATATEFDVQGIIVHTWSCESCEHEFRTSVGFRPVEA
jgi:hypothetical protein